MPQDTITETTSTNPPPSSTTDPQSAETSTGGTQSATEGTSTTNVVDPKLDSGVRDATVSINPKNNSGTRGL